MNYNSDTIAAIATAQGSGGIGIVRISGPDSKKIADKVFRAVSGQKILDARGYTAKFGKIFYKDELIDEAVALVFNTPHSYTGEDIVELSCHGGVYITKKVLRAVFAAGARPADSGEFTKRAFLNGKIELTQAESIMNLISAKGDQAAKIAISAKEGALYKRIENVKETLIGLAAHLSAWADYPEEDIAYVNEDELLVSIKDSQKELERLADTYDAGKAIIDGVETVIVGRPNVGKSTLMNLLSGCEKSIVTDIPGTTRDIVEEVIVLGDITLRLADTAGIHNTEDLVEKIGVKKAKEKINTAGLVLAVFNSSEELKQEDIDLIKDLKNVPSVAVINKTDLEQKIDYEYIKSNIKDTVMISAISGDGLEKLKEAVANAIGTSLLDPSAGVLANERQYRAVTNALSCILEAKQAIEFGMTLDAVTVSIEGAISELLELTGERASEKIVEGVFSKFCVGK